MENTAGFLFVPFAFSVHRSASRFSFTDADALFVAACVALGYRLVTDVTRTLPPLMERTGVASAAEVDIATLPDRMREEVVRQKATVVSPHLIAAWSRTAGS